MIRYKHTLIALFSATLLAGPASANILSNPGFEAGSGVEADDWLQVVGAAGTTERSSATPNSGTYHMHMRFDHILNPAAPTPYAIEQNLGAGTIDNTQNYDLSFYAKVDSTDFTGTDMFYQILWLDQDASHGGGVKGETLTPLIPAGISTSYQQFSLNDMNVPDGADSYHLRFQLSPGAVEDIANGLHIDDVSLALSNPPLEGDVNLDGFVGIADLNIVLGNWNAGTPPVAPGPDVISDFSGVNFDGTYVQFNTGTFTSAANDFTIQANDFGGGFFDLASPLDATGEGILELQLDVNPGNVADKINVVLVDADGTERVFRFDGLAVGDNQTLTVDLANFLQDNLPGTVAGLDLANITTFHVQGTFENGDPGLALDLTLDNLALIPGIVPLGPADVNGDGFVGIADLNIILGNWNAGTPPGQSAVPEPGTLALAVAGLMMAGCRRR